MRRAFLVVLLLLAPSCFAQAEEKKSCLLDASCFGEARKSSGLDFYVNDTSLMAGHVSRFVLYSNPQPSPILTITDGGEIHIAESMRPSEAARLVLRHFQSMVPINEKNCTPYTFGHLAIGRSLISINMRSGLVMDISPAGEVELGSFVQMDAHATRFMKHLRRLVSEEYFCPGEKKKQ